MKRYPTERAVLITATLCALPAFIWNYSIWSSILCSFVFLLAMLRLDPHLHRSMDQKKSACIIMAGSWAIAYVTAAIDEWLVGSWSAPWPTIGITLVVGFAAWRLTRQAGYFQGLKRIQPFVWLSNILPRIPGGKWLVNRIHKLYTSERLKPFFGIKLDVDEPELKEEKGERASEVSSGSSDQTGKGGEQQKRRKARKKASTVKAIVCPHCKRKTPAEGKHCDECGKPMPRLKAERVDSSTQSSCGCSTPTEGKYCGECGKPIDQPATKSSSKSHSVQDRLRQRRGRHKR